MWDLSPWACDVLGTKVILADTLGLLHLRLRNKGYAFIGNISTLKRSTF